MRKSFVGMLLLSSLVCAGCVSQSVRQSENISSPDDAVGLRCGILDLRQQRPIVIEETLEIPFVTRKEAPSFFFGCTIAHASLFQVHFAIKAPAKSQFNIKQNTRKWQREQAASVLTKKSYYVDFAHLYLNFDEGDVPGLYEVSIYIDDELFDVLVFDAQRRRVT